MNTPEGAAGYAVEFAEVMSDALLNHDRTPSATKSLIVTFLLNAFTAGYQKGLENGHKTKWAVVVKKYDHPHLPGKPFANGLSREMAVQVCDTANRVHPIGDLYFEIEPEEPKNI